MARRTYTADEMDAAVAVAIEQGLAAAARETGYPKSSIAQWVKAAGKSVEPVTRVLEAQAASRAAVVLRQAERIESVLEDIRSASGLYLHAVAVANRDYALAVLEEDADAIQTRVNPITGGVEAELTSERGRNAYKRVLALKHGAEIPHAVGMLTRATHDLQLLAGKATENQAVQVVFSAGLAGPSAGEVAALDEAAVVVEGEVVE